MEGTFLRKPEWLRRPPASSQETQGIKKLLRRAKLNTVCEEARCPNISECFGRGTATFMILGDVCTRGCRFCAVHTGKPIFSETQFKAEAENVADAAESLSLTHVVVTSVARDDLADGGASGFVETITALRRRIPGVVVEVLIPDFRGSNIALAAVLEAGPDVLNHNLETVPRLYRRVRPGASYRRSLDLLGAARRPGVLTKTGIMVGLGEKTEEVVQLMRDAREVGVELFTAGQYMQPSKEHLEVHEYVTPDIFKYYENEARELGFKNIAVGPLVRSSYYAEALVR